MLQSLVFIIVVLSFSVIQAEEQDIPHLSSPDYSDHAHRKYAFSEPFSGRKVDHYEVELEFPDNQFKKYLIPDDCLKVINEVSFGAANPVQIIDRNVWIKVINDCRYVALVPDHSSFAEHDFVSCYDFYNARLVDLPFASECEISTDGKITKECIIDEPGKLSITSFFPFLEFTNKSDPSKAQECRFTNGSFRGKLIATSEGIRCEYDRKAKGLRLISVDRQDLNADGYEDAVLRIMPLGRGVSRMPIVLPLTRKSHDEPFSIPQGLSMDFSIVR